MATSLDTAKWHSDNLAEITAKLIVGGIQKTGKRYKLPKINDLPNLTFKCAELFKEGHYDFVLHDYVFTNCWLQPVQKVGNNYVYHSGGYLIQKI